MLPTKTTLFFILTTLAAVTTAQTTLNATSAQPTHPTAKLLYPNLGNEQTLHASVINADASATTYLVGCPSGDDSESCSTDWKITQGPATAAFSYSMPDESDPIMLTAGWECSMGGTTLASCEYFVELSVTGSMDLSRLSTQWGFTETHTRDTERTVLGAEDMKTEMATATVTAGAQKLTQTRAPTRTAAGSPTESPGAAANIQVGGFSIGSALLALLML